MLSAKIFVACFVAVLLKDAQAVRHRIWHGEVPKDPADGRQYYEVAITDGIRNCTGAFVDTQWVLTSAKCLQKANVKVFYGDKKFDATKVYPSSLRFPHPGYSDRTNTYPVNDIGLLRLNLAVNDPNIVVLNLPKPATSYVGDIVTVSGWGALGNDGVIDGMLHELRNVEVIDNIRCSVSNRNYLTTRGRVICQGDLGSPMVKGDTIIGIATGNLEILNCDSAVCGVFTRVDMYVSWITSIIFRYTRSYNV